MKKLLTLFLCVCALSASAQNRIEVFEASIAELQSALDAGTTSSVLLVDQYLARIAAYDKQGPALNSIVRINPRCPRNRCRYGCGKGTQRAPQ